MSILQHQNPAKFASAEIESAHQHQLDTLHHHQHRTRTMVSIRLSVALYICTTVDAFSTTSPIQQIVKVSSRFTVPPLGGSKTAIPNLSSSTKPIAETSIVDDDDASANYSSWQKNLDVLLAPDTSVAERQIVLSGLLSSRDAIQKSVRTALREGKVSFIVFILVLVSISYNLYMPTHN
jgi:hypothetical protein